MKPGSYLAILSPPLVTWQGLVEEVAVATIIQDKHRGNDDRHQRWARLERADLFARYSGLHAQGVSQRQAAKVLDVPRSTLQAWRAYQDRLDACPAVVAFFQSVPGLAFLHRLVMALHVVCVEIGACGIRLVCLLLQTHGPQSVCRRVLWDPAPGQPSR